MRHPKSTRYLRSLIRRGTVMELLGCSSPHVTTLAARQEITTFMVDGELLASRQSVLAYRRRRDAQRALDAQLEREEAP